LHASKKGAYRKEREEKRAGKKNADKNFAEDEITRRQYRAEDICPRAKIPRGHLTANAKKKPPFKDTAPPESR
jgi:hypothetical protein